MDLRSAMRLLLPAAGWYGMGGAAGERSHGMAGPQVSRS